MIPGALTRRILEFVDHAAGILGRSDLRAPHLLVGKAGEEAAYFHLRSLGYVIVARNFRSPLHHGEIDLIGWDGDTLCFIEVKTRSSHSAAPPEEAVDLAKRDDLRRVARDYIRRLRSRPAARFDIVAVHLESDQSPQISVFKDAFVL